jgi:hypothetical protein
MALKKIVEIEGQSFVKSSLGTVDTGSQKITFSAVCKVTAIRGNKNELKFDVSHSNDTKTFQRSYFFRPSIADGSPNFIKQAYLYLKTLPEFSGAEDC